MTNPCNNLEKSIYRFVKSTLTNPIICAKFNKRTGSVADKATQWLDLGQIKMKAVQTGILCNNSYFQIWAFGLVFALRCEVGKITFLKMFDLFKLLQLDRGPSDFNNGKYFQIPLPFWAGLPYFPSISWLKSFLRRGS